MTPKQILISRLNDFIADNECGNVMQQMNAVAALEVKWQIEQLNEMQACKLMRKIEEVENQPAGKWDFGSVTVSVTDYAQFIE